MVLKSMDLDLPKELKLLQDDCPLLKSEFARMLVEINLEELEKKFVAYICKDVYGPIGRDDLPAIKKVLLGLAFVTLVLIRVALVMSILLFYYLICRVSTLFLMLNQDEEEEEQEDFAHIEGWRRAMIVWSRRFLSRVMLFVLGFYWINESYRDLKDEADLQQK